MSNNEIQLMIVDNSPLCKVAFEPTKGMKQHRKQWNEAVKREVPQMHSPIFTFMGKVLRDDDKETLSAKGIRPSSNIFVINEEEPCSQNTMLSDGDLPSQEDHVDLIESGNENNMDTTVDNNNEQSLADWIAQAKAKKHKAEKQKLTDDEYNQYSELLNLYDLHEAKSMMPPPLYNQYQSLHERFTEHGRMGGKAKAVNESLPEDVNEKLPQDVNESVPEAQKIDISIVKEANMNKKLDELKGINTPTESPIMPSRPLKLVRTPSFVEKVDEISIIDKNELIEFFAKNDFRNGDWHFRHLFRFWVSTINHDVEPQCPTNIKHNLNVIYAAHGDNNKCPAIGTGVKKITCPHKSIDYKAKVSNEDHDNIIYPLHQMSKNKFKRWEKNSDWLSSQLKQQNMLLKAHADYLVSVDRLHEIYSGLCKHGDECVPLSLKEKRENSQEFSTSVMDIFNDYFEPNKKDNNEEEEVQFVPSPKRNGKGKGKEKSIAKGKRTPSRKAKTKGRRKTQQQVGEEQEVSEQLKTLFTDKLAKKDLKEIYTCVDDHYNLASEIAHYGWDYKFYLETTLSPVSQKNYWDRYRKIFDSKYDVINEVRDIGDKDWYELNTQKGTGDRNMCANFRRFLNWLDEGWSESNPGPASSKKRKRK